MHCSTASRVMAAGRGASCTSSGVTAAAAASSSPPPPPLARTATAARRAARHPQGVRVRVRVWARADGGLPALRACCNGAARVDADVIFNLAEPEGRTTAAACLRALAILFSRLHTPGDVAPCCAPRMPPAVQLLPAASASSGVRVPKACEGPPSSTPPVIVELGGQ
jgi:hypothetical protein